MAFKIVTGRGESAHVTSDDDGWLYALTLGDGRYLLSGLECSMTDANTAHISQGHLLIDGRQFRNSKDGSDLAIANGTQGKRRIDLIVCRYEFVPSGADYYEYGTFEVIRGEAVDDDPQVPSYVDGSILEGDRIVEIPLFTIPIDGITVGEPSLCMLDGYELPAKYGGSGVAVELIAGVQGAIDDANAAAASANAAAQKAAAVNEDAATSDELEQLSAQISALTGSYLAVGDVLYVPTSKGYVSGNALYLYPESAEIDGNTLILK